MHSNFQVAICFHDVYAFEEHGITDKTEQLDIMANADDELRNPGLRWIDEVFGEYACNPRCKRRLLCCALSRWWQRQLALVQR